MKRQDRPYRRETDPNEDGGREPIISASIQQVREAIDDYYRTVTYDAGYTPTYAARHQRLVRG